MSISIICSCIKFSCLLCSVILWNFSQDATSTTPAPVTTAADNDISRLGKSLDIDGDDDTKDGYDKEAADVLFQEMSGELSGWKSKYYVCLGFFLVFFAFFLIVIAVLVYKLKSNKVWFAY